MGIVDGNKAESDGLGCESAGIVTQVGPDVKNLKIGDQVAVFSGNSYSTSLTTGSKLCVKMADGLTFEEAATMPCVYGTVIYSLLEIAKLEKDQVRLILCGDLRRTYFADGNSDRSNPFCMRWNRAICNPSLPDGWRGGKSTLRLH